jgi:hypothetical protein
MDEFYDSLPQRVKDLKKVAKDPASAARFEELFNDQSGMDWHINDIIGYYEYMIKNGPMDPAGYEDARMTDAGLEEGFDPIRPLDLKHWAQKVKMYYPDAQFIRAKMPGGPSIAKSGGAQVGSFEPSKGTSKIIRPQGVSSIAAGSTMEEGVAEGNDDVWGPQGNFTSDTKVELGGVSIKPISKGDMVKYFGEPAQVVELSKDKKVARITFKNRALTQNVKTSDLKKLGQGLAEDDADDVEQRMLAKIEREKQRLAQLKKTDPAKFELFGPKCGKQS